MKAAVFVLLCASHAAAATITVTITGTTGQIKVGEGPIFDHNSYQSIPPGAPFSLTYTFDDQKGKQSIAAVSAGLITRSLAEDPGTNAVLQIGTSVWEFGPPSHSHVALDTTPGNRNEELQYASQGGGNRVSARIKPADGGFWPRNADWRSSFTATSIHGSDADFSADNDRVSARGNLLPQEITVAGIDLDGQWLQATADHKWQLAHASPAGGYVIAEVSTVVRGITAAGSPITPGVDQYWQAWRINPGARSAEASTPLPQTSSSGATGEQNVTVVARFYEGLALPATFDQRLMSASNPMCPTDRATLPAAFSITRRLE